jgi:hypothetical protein
MIDILLPQIQKLISEKTINAFKKNGTKTVATGLYKLLPGYVRLVVKEKNFIDFCLTHQESIFGKSVSAKKIVAKKLPVKKAVKKLPVKKTIR